MNKLMIVMILAFAIMVVTSAKKGDDCSSMGKVISNRNSRGGVNIGKFTESECVEKCLTDDTCIAVDWNKKASTCWIHKTVSTSQKQSCCNRYEKTKKTCTSIKPKLNEDAAADCQEYKGIKSTSVDGSICLEWKYFPEYAKYESNYCRKVEGNNDDAYCIVKDMVELEYVLKNCGVPLCSSSDCREFGVEYEGIKSTSIDGSKCEEWKDFPKYAKYENNFCRKVEGNNDDAYCIVKDEVENEYVLKNCGVPFCSSTECRVKGEEYKGTISTSSAGLNCEKWSSFGKNYDANYCRNSKGTDDDAFCIVATTSGRYFLSNCGIPICM